MKGLALKNMAAISSSCNTVDTQVFKQHSILFAGNAGPLAVFKNLKRNRAIAHPQFITPRKLHHHQIVMAPQYNLQYPFACCHFYFPYCLSCSGTKLLHPRLERLLGYAAELLVGQL